MPNEFVGDERGRVAVEFTPKALTEFIAMWNGAELVYDGWITTLAATEYQPGKVDLTVWRARESKQ